MKKSLISIACKCGILVECAEDRSIPILNADDRFFLVFHNKRKEIINFCFFCGGNELGPSTEQTDECRCNVLEEWSKDIFSSVKFDDKFYEYYLEGKDGSTRVFYFCPSCRGRLAKSKRDDFSILPSRSEVDAIYENIKDAETIDELIKVLGVPDDKVVLDSAELQKEKLHGRKPVKQTLIYHSVAKTFSLVIVEDWDGKIHFLSAGKRKNTA